MIKLITKRADIPSGLLLSPVNSYETGLEPCDAVEGAMSDVGLFRASAICVHKLRECSLAKAENEGHVIVQRWGGKGWAIYYPTKATYDKFSGAMDWQRYDTWCYIVTDIPGPRLSARDIQRAIPSTILDNDPIGATHEIIPQ